MARIAGVDLQDSWRLGYALTKIKGVGWSRSKALMNELGFGEEVRVKALSPQEVSKIASALEQFDIEGDLARKVRENIKRAQAIGSYRGARHAKGLPVRGQKTRSNARTKRGARKTIGAFKKEDLAKQAK